MYCPHIPHHTNVAKVPNNEVPFVYYYYYYYSHVVRNYHKYKSTNFGKLINSFSFLMSTKDMALITIDLQLINIGNFTLRSANP